MARFYSRLRCCLLCGSNDSVKNDVQHVSTWLDGKTEDVRLEVRNHSPLLLAAYWIDYEGKLQLYYTIKPDGAQIIGLSATLTVLPRAQLKATSLQHSRSSAPDDSADTSWQRPEWGDYRERARVTFPIMAYECVSQAAVDAACCCINHMLAGCRPDIVSRMVIAGCTVAIIGRCQVTTDVPAHRFMRAQAADGLRDIDATTRGLGATTAVPTTSCSEENLIMVEDGRYPHESILVHELGHAVMNLGFSAAEHAMVQGLYRAAWQQRLYDRGCYMMDNADEYWAEATQAWFGATVRTDVNSGINTRSLLQQRDPGLAQLLAQVYGTGHWQYTDTSPGEFQVYENVAWDSARTYDVLGPDDGQPVVLVHGALVGRHCLVLEARHLAAAGFRVILPDLPAHGARFKEALSLDSAVATLLEVIKREVPGRKVVVMGFSMGGYVAAAFAAAHPDLMAGVVIAAAAHDCHTLSWKLVGKAAECVYAVCSPKVKSQFIYKSYPEVMAPARPEVQECFLRCGAEFDAWKFTWRVMYDANMHVLLPSITCPALLVVGEKDFRDGIHQFMLQEGLVDVYRTEAVSFLRGTAEWDYVRGSTLASAAVKPTKVVGLSGAGDDVGVTANKTRVGLMEVVGNVWRQWK
eukprot:gene12948-13076_t